MVASAPWKSTSAAPRVVASPAIAVLYAATSLRSDVTSASVSTAPSGSGLPVPGTPLTYERALVGNPSPAASSGPALSSTFAPGVSGVPPGPMSGTIAPVVSRVIGENVVANGVMVGSGTLKI